MTILSNEYDAVHYKNGQKNNWRRFVWNRIADIKRAGELNLQAPILYLPGAADLDSIEAVRRGFRSHDLIAVESSSTVTNLLRSKKRNTIHGKLETVLTAWPQSQPLSAVIADFQCGFSDSVAAALLAWMVRGVFARSVLVLNMQRGREVGGYGERMKELGLIDLLPPGVASSPRHRAVLSTATTLWTLCHIAKVLPENALSWFLSCNPIVPKSYKSTPKSPVFDSLILTKTQAFPHACDGNYGVDEEDPEWDGIQDMRRRISAALAVRTARLNQ